MKKIEETTNIDAPEIWEQTYSCRKFDLIDPLIEDINIVDIAHSLSNISRFGGHLNRTLSVAQHSLTVAAAMRKDGIKKEIALQGLMHDAHEAYLGDITKPVKLLLEYKYGFRWDGVEKPFKASISERFGINIINPDPLVKKYDDAVMRTEAEDLFDRIVDNWTSDIQFRLKDHIKTILTPDQSYTLFVSTFKELGGKI